MLDDSPVRKSETIESDALWNRIINLELVPHPDHPRPEIVEMDYGMKDGAGYMLQRWSVDCSPDHHLRKSSGDAGSVRVDCALWLKDPLSLYGSEADLAPGYVDPRPDHANKIRAM